MVNLARSAAPSRGRNVAYWTSTAIVAAEFLVGGVMDLMRVPPFFGVMLHLGYPPYFSAIIGTWKVLGAAAVLLPRSARLKEWAYAGMVFDLTGAAASHFAVGNGAGAVVVPLVFTALVMVSWALRPQARRDLCPKDT